MSEFFIRTKSAAYGASGLELDNEQLALINQHTLRAMKAEELFAFKVTMCDNEIDRDTEAFTTATLRQLSDLFVGKPVISDHSWKAENQCARIYSVQPKTESGKKTAYGELYVMLEAYCYMPRNSETQKQISLIEAGIMKEVSVGCSTRKNTCSICGNPYWSGDCEHRRGIDYAAGKCFIKLEDAVDAYELSFAAVPAQPAAGVTKGAEKEGEPESFRAELHGVMGALKEIHESVRQLEKSAGGNQKQDAAAAQQDNTPDPEIEALIRSAKALIQNTKGVN